MHKKYKHLTIEDREFIEELLTKDIKLATTSPPKLSLPLPTLELLEAMFTVNKKTKKKACRKYVI